MDNKSGSMGIAGLKVGSLNCNGLGEKRKLQKLLTWLIKKQENILFLQETHSTIEAEDTWKKVWGGDQVYFSHGASNSTGVAILLKKNENIEVNEIRTICQGRVLLMEITHNKVKYCLVNIYSPNRDDQRFILKNVFRNVRQKSCRLSYYGRNAVLDNNLDMMVLRHSTQSKIVRVT